MEAYHSHIIFQQNLYYKIDLYMRYINVVHQSNYCSIFLNSEKILNVPILIFIIGTTQYKHKR